MLKKTMHPIGISLYFYFFQKFYSGDFSELVERLYHLLARLFYHDSLVEKTGHWMLLISEEAKV